MSQKVSILKRLLELDFESAHADNERLASARLLEEREQLITSLKAELVELKSERDTLHEG